MDRLVKKVRFLESGTEVVVDIGKNLLDVIREQNMPIHADCGGIGRCGKCRVVVNGKARLACRAHVAEDIEVLISGQDADRGYSILVDTETQAAADNVAAAPGPIAADGQVEALGDGNPAAALAPAAADSPIADNVAAADGPIAADSNAEMVIAIDIGTTTIVGKLLDAATGNMLSHFAQLNAQRAYGADVISRINASLDDSSALSALVTAQIDQAIATMLAEGGVQARQVKRVVIAGNTTMAYILLGLPCRSLGLAPFKPEFDYPVINSYSQLFKAETLACECFLLPFISAYVGGDLTAGLSLLAAEDDFILMDMGTNGELVFKRGDRLVCTATAAGPAFEGGNIECGSGSTKGAISAVSYSAGQWRCQTIGAAPPGSICGSGILDLMAVLINEGFVDTTGCMDDSIVDGRVVLAKAAGQANGNEVFFTQKDLRQFQLAKSAIRSGLEIIVAEMGSGPPSKVFLAGGFGQNLNPQSALATGLLPASFAGRVRSIGNSSLNGAVKLALNAAARDSIEDLASDGQEINLAEHRLFNNLFMENMYFEKIA